MTTGGRRLLRPILGLRDPARRLGALICCVLVSAGLTSLIGLHVVFGALLCGLVTPRSESGQPDSALLTPMRHLAMALLPVFFVTAGMNVRADRVSQSFSSRSRPRSRWPPSPSWCVGGAARGGPA